MPDSAPPGTPRRWLVVEDEGLIAMLVQDAVEEMGLTVIGPAARVGHALKLVDEQAPEAAILDVNLNGEKIYPVADLLLQRNIPFVFLTGAGEADLPEQYRGRPTIRKPFSPGEIQSAIGRIAGVLA